MSAILKQSSVKEFLSPQAFLLPQLVQSIQPPQLSNIHPIPQDQLMAMQYADPYLSRVLCFVERRRRPSRRECAHEPADVLRFLRLWEKLTVKSGVLYRVSKDIVSKKKTYQYLVPITLKEKVLKGVHDEAGHQG
ncbi:hypothetical protein LDENG_00065950 [Lucifuga dentata]|nr:hypothetical protein LDENG_00065950 [Lucifuga dentata]